MGRPTHMHVSQAPPYTTHRPTLIYLTITINSQHRQLRFANPRRLLDPPKVFLTSFPFDLRVADALKLSRYLVEQGRQSRVEFDFEKKINFDIFLSIIKNLFRDYSSYTTEELNDEFAEAKVQINSKQMQIRESFFKLYNIRSNYCDFMQLKNNFHSNEICLSVQQMNIIIMKLYLDRKDLYHLNFKKLFDK